MNMDLVTRVPQLPSAGETVIGNNLRMFPGGKGANQAVAAARLGGQTTMIARIGDDAYGQILLESLAAECVNTINVQVTPATASGVAMIGVDANGQNAIMVIPGANEHLTPTDIAAHELQIANADVLLLQLEIPTETTIAALSIAEQSQVTTILDPAPTPAAGMADELLQVDIITPNRTEAEQLTGVRITDLISAEEAAIQLQKRGAQQVVITLGAKGALCVARDGEVQHVAACEIEALDTTAAGDAFAAALAVQIGREESLADAVQMANIAGAIAATRHGAQASLPRAAEIEALLQQ